MNAMLPFSVAIAVTIFAALLIGSEASIAELPTFRGTNYPECKSGGDSGILGFFDDVAQAIVCGVKTTLGFVVDLLNVSLAVVFFFGSVIAFNVPGAPWYGRMLITAVVGGGLVLGLVLVVKGGR